ncbi:fungal specific transcription factor domain-containing protein [Aspergillus thermomutatus]|uniref:Xylanolytic transcriptional activator regulatory domain-containing protein n=1 Tax=Aspergillus thermomutatus TaxID=41047 RepID=A0A397FXF4_ASPTH|nr:uncharacterized protein CDV56_100415 [Aspergillus thermomutatus]RHZ43217.1 hypothetical protein CDV56_100415 [Aspergillus thermomutatus]
MDRIPDCGASGLIPSAIERSVNDSRSFFPPWAIPSRAQSDVGSPTERLENLRQQLATMLPCQRDVDCLLSSSHGWWLVQQHMMAHLPDSVDNDAHMVFNVSAISKKHPIMIARLLFCVAICIQQLPPDMDMQTIQTTTSLREMMSSIIEFLNQKVTSDDEMIGNFEGVECLALQGIYEVNAGNLRRSWLCYRKAITIAQLLGLHRMYVQTDWKSQELALARRRHLWCQVSRGERYLSVILGVPSATGPGALPFDDDAAWLSPEDIYHKHLYHIAGLILARNQETSTHSFSTTQRIGEQLDSLAEQMPSPWWEVPTNILNNRTKEASVQFERVMCQIWHFELAVLLHLPFMLLGATDRRYEYSRTSCLDASRNLIKRWLAIRASQRNFYFSNLLEFEVFTAATTLLLGLLGPHRSTDPDALQVRTDDAELVETVVQNFERLKQHGSGMSVGDQSISVIRTLQSFLQGRHISGNLRLEIPFFGTIKIARSGAVEALEGERVLGANAPRNILFHRPTQLATSPSVTGPEPSVGRQEPQAKVVNTGSYAGKEMGSQDTALRFSDGHLQFSETSDIPGILDGKPPSYVRLTRSTKHFQLEHIPPNNRSSRTQYQKKIMALKTDTASILAAAETHILSYCADLTSPIFKTSSERAAKMATYYLPTISFFTEGTITQLSDRSLYVQLIAGPLDKLGGLPEVKGHKVEAVGENSAIIWLVLEVKGIEISNVYFFRKMEDGAEGFEGGIFDGEIWMLKQLAKE